MTLRIVVLLVGFLAALGFTPEGRARAQSVSRRTWSASQFVGMSGASVSRDGRYVLYTDWSSGDLAVHDLRTGRERRVTHKDATEFEQFAESFMRVSADGRDFFYVWDNQPEGYELRAIEGAGATPRVVFRRASSRLAAYDVSSDGRHIVAVIAQVDAHRPAARADEIVLIASASGETKSLRTLTGNRPQTMAFSPDGQFVAFDLANSAAAGHRDVFVIETRSGHETAAIAGGADDRLLGWSPDGRTLLLASNRDGARRAWLQPVDNGELRGAATIAVASLPESATPLGITRTGDFFYMTPANERSVHIATVGQRARRFIGAAESVGANGAGTREAADWSPDGRRIAYVRDSRTIVVRDLVSGSERVLTTMPAIFSAGFGDRYARWSPNGQQLLVPAGGSLIVVDAATGQSSRLPLGIRARYGRWSRDGRRLFYANLSSDRLTTQIVSRDLETHQEQVIYRSPPELARAHDDFHSLELSPDEQWLAFGGAARTTDLDTRVVLVSVTGGDTKTLVQVPPAEFVTVVGWTPDSREVLFTRDRKFATQRSASLWAISIGGGRPRRFTTGRNVLNSIRFHPDGRRVVFDSGERGTHVWVIDGLFSRSRNRLDESVFVTARAPNGRGDSGFRLRRSRRQRGASPD